MADRKPGELPDPEEIVRKAKERIRELERAGLVKPEKKEPLPTATPELWPGGPSVDTGDILLARRAAQRRKRRQGYA